MITQIFQDAVFAAIAAIGFSAISCPPRKAFLWCALIAAAGHSARYVMLNCGSPLHIIPATAIASLLIGFLAVFAARQAKFPAEVCLYPALLPMIPGIYAYKTFGGLALCLSSATQAEFTRSFYLFAHNALTCGALLVCMVLGATLPIFILKKIAFQATRSLPRP